MASVLRAGNAGASGLKTPKFVDFTVWKCNVSGENTHIQMTYLKFNIKVITIN